MYHKLSVYLRSNKAVPFLAVFFGLLIFGFLFLTVNQLLYGLDYVQTTYNTFMNMLGFIAYLFLVGGCVLLLISSRQKNQYAEKTYDQKTYDQIKDYPTSFAQKIKLHIPAIIIILATSLIMIGWMKGELYSMWDTTIPPFYPQKTVVSFSYVWDYSLVGGKYFIYLCHWPYHALVYLLNFVFTVGIASTFVYWFLYFVCGLSMYFFVTDTLKWSAKKNMVVAAISAIFYMVNPYWIFRVNSMSITIWILAFLPLLLLCLRRALLSENKTKLAIYSILGAFCVFAMTTGLGDIPNGLATGIFVFLYLLILAVWKRKIKFLALTMAIFVTVALLGSFWWIGPQFFQQTILSALARSSSYVSQSLASIKAQILFVNYFNVLGGTPYEVPFQRQVTGSVGMIWSPNIYLLQNDLFFLITLTIAIIAYLALASKQAHKRSDYFIFAIIILLAAPFITSLNPPSNFLVEWLINNSPLFVFRRPYNYYFLIEFSFSYMFGIGIIILYDWLKKKTKFKYNHKWNYGLIGFILIIVLVVNAFPLWTGFNNYINLTTNNTLQPVSATVQVPDYVQNLANYLNSLNDQGGVIVLPRSGFLRAYNWTQGYFGLDYYSLVLNRPVLSWLSNNEPMYYLYLLAERDVEGNYSSFAQLLTLMDIRYIIVAEDALNNPATEEPYGQVFSNITAIETYLETQPNITLIRTFASSNPSITGRQLLYKVTANENPQTFYPTSMIYPEINQTMVYTLDDYYNTAPENPWIASDALSVTYNNSTTNIVYQYTAERRDMQFYWARMYNTVPFSLNPDIEYSYLYLNVTESPNAVIELSVGKPGSDIGLTPIKIENGTNSSLYEYDISSVLDPSTITLSIGVVDTTEVGNYSVSINEFSFETANDTVSSFMNTWRSLVSLQAQYSQPLTIVDIPNASMYDLNNNSIDLIADEINPTSYELTVINSTQPFVLASSITYSQDWVATINGTLLEHTQLDDIYNGWIVNATGTFKIEITFTLQETQQQFYRLSEFSIIAATLSLVILVLFNKKRQKAIPLAAQKVPS